MEIATMQGENELARHIAFTYISELRSQLELYLRDPFLLGGRIGQVIQRKSTSNEQYGLDEAAQKILIEALDRHKFTGKVFSEESGWIDFGGHPRLKAICDPFDSTFLVTRSIILPATSLCFVDEYNNFICCAIADLGNDVTYFADMTGAYAFIYSQGQWKSKGRIHVSAIERLEEAFIVLPTLQPTRRQHLGSEIFRTAWYWMNVSGAMFIGKMASGFIDAYLDPFKGQLLYEITCAELVLRAGGVVSNRDGEPFALSSIVERLEAGDTTRYPIVASCTSSLHQAILQIIGVQTQKG